jgi:hypothetical protein
VEVRNQLALVLRMLVQVVNEANDLIVQALEDHIGPIIRGALLAVLFNEHLRQATFGKEVNVITLASIPVEHVAVQIGDVTHQTEHVLVALGRASALWLLDFLGALLL